MNLPRPRPLPPSIPAAGLAALALLLVLGFVVTTTYDLDRSPMKLPAIAASVRAERGSACLAVERRARPEGGELVVYRFSDGEGSTRSLDGPEAIYLEASRAVDRDPQRVFLLKADASIRWAVVDDAIERLRGAGARHLVFWTRGAAEEGRP